VKRWIAALFVACAVLGCAVWITALAAELPQVNLNVSSAGPREVEDTTQKAVARDYARAWASMIAALSENRMEGLDDNFVGVALENLKDRVNQQQQSGLHTKYVDRGHKLNAVFYSYEGSAIQLRDIAQLEVQYLDGDKLFHSERLTEYYTGVMTPGENRWKVRVLQAAIGQ
jgi:hypothetical protein